MKIIYKLVPHYVIKISTKNESWDLRCFRHKTAIDFFNTMKNCVFTNIPKDINAVSDTEAMRGLLGHTVELQRYIYGKILSIDKFNKEVK